MLVLPSSASDRLQVIVVDSNVISPLLRDEPDARAIGWLDSQPPKSVWLTAISLFELRYGIEILPLGRRRDEIERGLVRVLAGFQDRILDFNTKAASAAALVAARRRKTGRTRKIRDTLIAGIVVSHRADFATRNVRHFDDLGIQVIDPWAGQPMWVSSHAAYKC